MVQSAQLLGAACGAALVIVTYGLCRSTGASARMAIVGCVLVSLSTPLLAWSASGMGTALYTLLLSAGLYILITGHSRWGSGLLVGMSFGLATMTRPDGLMRVNLSHARAAP